MPRVGFSSNIFQILVKYFRFKKLKKEEIKTNVKVEEFSYDQVCVGFQDAMHLTTGLIIIISIVWSIVTFIFCSPPK
jgi:hypothetical protein